MSLRNRRSGHPRRNRTINYRRDNNKIKYDCTSPIVLVLPFVKVFHQRSIGGGQTVTGDGEERSEDGEAGVHTPTAADYAEHEEEDNDDYGAGLFAIISHFHDTIEIMFLGHCIVPVMLSNSRRYLLVWH